MSDKFQAGQALPSKEQLNGLVSLISSGRFPEAHMLGTNLVRQFPNIPFIHNVLGIIHFHSGNMEQAIACYNQALRIKPDFAEALNNLATALQKMGQFKEAIAAYQQALRINPNYAMAYRNLGDLNFDLGKFNEAVSNYAKALGFEPNSCELHINIALALREIGRNKEALTHSTKAVQIRSDDALAHNSLGSALAAVGKYQEAVASFAKALQLNPSYPEALNNLGNAQKVLGKLDETLNSYLQAITIEPDNLRYWENLSLALDHLAFPAYTDRWAEILVGLLNRKTITRPSDLVTTVVNLLKLHPEIQAALRALTSDHLADSTEEICLKLARIPLLLCILPLCPIPDFELEALLRALRHKLLLNRQAIKNKAGILGLQTALALNCFTNEFVFGETPEEAVALDALQAELASAIGKKVALDGYAVSCLASYRPLYRYPWLQQASAPAGLELLFERQIKDVQKEQELRLKIRTLKQIEDKVSTAVRQQYEENPYPRWVNTQALSKASTISKVVTELELKLLEKTKPFSENPNILIAGCGTGQHSISTARRFANSQVLAVDLSLSSLSYAIRKTTELGVENIEYMQGDILDLGLLNKQFDIVESAGVLHHMEDPMAGWKVLVACLKPGGLMKIALYSELARQHVVKARDLIASMGLSSEPSDMIKLRLQIMHSDDELLAKLRNFRDLFSLSELRDLLFHVQEHRFTIPQIKSALATLGLSFSGFDSVSEQYKKQFKQDYPNPEARYNLDIWHEFEQKNPTVFVGMYQFWVQKR